MMTTRRIAMMIGLPLLVVGGWLADPTAADRSGGRSASSLQEQALQLTHDNACLRAEAELAKEDQFYLVLDPAQHSLSLKLHGTILRELEFATIEIGRPRRAFLRLSTPDDVRARPHRQGRLSPRRPLARLEVEIPDDPDGDNPTVMLPPEPETAIEVPRRFFIRYEGGVALEFRTDDGGIGVRQRIADAFATLFGGSGLRLRLDLDRAEAEAFFRSVPDETALLVR